jgi:hypothetical protein
MIDQTRVDLFEQRLIDIAVHSFQRLPRPIRRE